MHSRFCDATGLLPTGRSGQASRRFLRRLRWRRKRPSSRRLPLRGIRSISLTSLAPPLRRSSTILRLWKASSSARCADADDGGLRQLLRSPCSIILSWLFSSSAEVASSSTMMSGLCRNSRAKASRCFSPPDSVWSHGASSSIFSLRWPSPTLSQGLADLLDGPVVGGAGIGGRAAQRARRHVGLLRQHEQPPVGMEIDAAAAPWPQPGDGAHQRALAGAGFAGHQHPLAGLDHDFGLADHGGAVVERHREVVQAEHGVALGLAALDAAEAVAAARRARARRATSSARRCGARRHSSRRAADNCRPASRTRSARW